MMKKTVALVTAVMFAAMGFTGCSNNKNDTGVKEIVFSQNGWDSQTLHNEIAKLVVENGYEGYSVKQSVASSNMNWQALLDGEVHLDIESWTDNVVSYPDDIASGKIVDLGDLVPDSLSGLYVLRYVIEGYGDRGMKAY